MAPELNDEDLGLAPADEDPGLAPGDEVVDEDPELAPGDEVVDEDPGLAPGDEVVDEDPGLAPSDEVADEDLGLAPGDTVADAEVVEPLAVGGGFACWRAKRADGSEATVHALLPSVEGAVRDRFLAVASEHVERSGGAAIDGLATIAAVDPVAGAYVADVSPLGTVLDLPVLKWGADKQLEFVRRLCRSLERMHAAGLIHGCLRPENVLLDGDLAPLLVNAQALDIADACRSAPGVADDYRSYTPPEVRTGEDPTERTDVYGVGRLLHFMLLGDHPKEMDEDLPRLDSLRHSPPGLVRILRKATSRSVTQRYADMAALQADLDRYAKDEPTGLKHPEIDDLVRFSERPHTTSEGPSSTAAPKIRIKPEDRTAASAPPPIAAIKLRTGERPPLLAWTPVRAIVFAVLGLGLVVGATVASYLSGEDSLSSMILALLGAALAGLAVPGFGRVRVLSRILGISVMATAVYVVNPTRIGAESSTRLEGLAAASVQERLEALKELKAGGQVEFPQLDLAGADLQGLDFAKLVLDGGSLKGARCKDLDLSSASLLNVDVTDADFSGAELDGTNPDFLKGWPLAQCDLATTMPTGWRCTDGHPVKQD